MSAMRESDIRNPEAHARYLELVRIDAEALAADPSRLVRIDCPACGGSDHGAEFEKFGFVYELCHDCDTLFANPRPSHEALLALYGSSESTRFWVEEFFKPVAEARREKIFRPRAQHIAERFPDLAGAAVGDIGAGFGLFLEELRAVWPQAGLTAIEPSADMAAICREKGIDVVESMLEDLDPAEHRFDLLTSFELIEHLHDPLLFLQKTRELLNHGGHLYLTTLNGMGFDIQVHWADSRSIFPPQHLNFMNPGSLTALLERAGFAVDEVTTPGELDWDIVQGRYVSEGLDPGRFFRTVHKHGTDEAKRALQGWIRDAGFSSHMRVLARPAPAEPVPARPVPDRKEGA